MTLFHRSTSTKVVTSFHRSDCYRLERPVVGRELHPLKTHAFARRTTFFTLPCSIPGLHVPLSTLQAHPYGDAHMTRGQCGSLILHCTALASATPYQLSSTSEKYPTSSSIKAWIGLRQFLYRGLDEIRTEWLWACTAFNLAKLVRVVSSIRRKTAATHNIKHDRLRVGDETDSGFWARIRTPETVPRKHSVPSRPERPLCCPLHGEP